MAAASSAVVDPLIQQALLGEAVDERPAALFVLGEDRKYVAVNGFAGRRVGYELAALLALEPAHAGPDADVSADVAEWNRGGTTGGTAHLKTESGELIPVTYRASETTAARMRFWISIAFPE